MCGDGTMNQCPRSHMLKSGARSMPGARPTVGLGRLHPVGFGLLLVRRGKLHETILLCSAINSVQNWKQYEANQWAATSPTASLIMGKAISSMRLTPWGNIYICEI